MPGVVTGDRYGPGMGVTAGISCQKSGFGCTIIDGGTATDHQLDAPSNLTDRGEVLDWILTEAERFLVGQGSPPVRIAKAGAGKFAAAAERNEVEAAVQIAAFRARSECGMLTTEGVRAALGAPKATGAYKVLLARPEVKARSNEQRRHQYLLAKAAGK